MDVKKLTYELVKDLLPEVGEGTVKGYPYIKNHDVLELDDGEYLWGTVVYSFTPPSGLHYDVVINYDYDPEEQGKKYEPGDKLLNIAKIDFSAEESYEATNRQELYSIMTTVGEILKKELNRPEVKDRLDAVQYIPAQGKSRNVKPGENSVGGTQRDKLYLAYINKAVPTSRVEHIRDKYTGKEITRVHLKESYKGKRTNQGAPGTLKAKISKLYGGDVTIEKAKKLKNRENATAHDKRQANWFINFHSKNENIEPAETSGKAAPYGSGYKKLEEELTPLIVELTQYMYEQGLPMDPAPSLEFIEDESNAQNPLGRTAFYDPNNQHIVLYITGRHPKDILRSFAHEMIHHTQNLEGRLAGIGGTTDINEDDHLKEIEREAYEKGNLYFRSWENSKNK